jgi:type I restriction enzyme S subunit
LVGEDRDGLNLALIKSIVLPLPPLPIQKTIAAYLDKGTSRIDELIVKKERQIELLQEKRQAIITRAVTKGLDPKAKMVDSGVVWIGEIPEGWKVTRLKYLASMLSGFAFHSEDFNDTGIQLIKISNLYCNKLQLERQPTFVPESFKENYKEWLVTNGDILMSMTGTLGKRDYGFAIQIENEEEEFLLNQRVSKIVPKPNITANMLVHIVRSDYFQNQIFLLPSGTKQGNFSNEQILGTYVIYPPKKEIQNEITMFIKGQFVANDKLIHKIEASISLLREYRSSLITAAVSGQIDVAKMEVAG